MRRVQREDENVPDARRRESNADTETNARKEIAVFARVSFALLEIVVRETTGVSNVSRVGVAGGRERVGEKTEREGGRAVAKVTARITTGVHCAGSAGEIRRADSRGEKGKRGESEKGERREWRRRGDGDRRRSTGRRNGCAFFFDDNVGSGCRSRRRSATRSGAAIRAPRASFRRRATTTTNAFNDYFFFEGTGGGGYCRRCVDDAYARAHATIAEIFTTTSTTNESDAATEHDDTNRAFSFGKSQPGRRVVDSRYRCNQRVLPSRHLSRGDEHGKRRIVAVWRRHIGASHGARRRRRRRCCRATSANGVHERRAARFASSGIEHPRR